jgi:hypothetical protein
MHCAATTVKATSIAIEIPNIFLEIYLKSRVAVLLIEWLKS